MTQEEKALEIIDKLDEYTQNQNYLEYGLLMHGKHINNMKEIILTVLNKE